MSKRILVIDDDTAILMGIQLLLEEAGYTVETNTRGEVVPEKMKDFKPDLLILDVMLQTTDGREIARTLKNAPDTKNIPIIMISAGYNSPENMQNCGANDFIAKPFDTKTLLASVQKHLQS